MSGVFAGNQWTTPSGSTWSILIEPDFVNEVAELCNHLSLASAEARQLSEGIVTKAQAASGDDGTPKARKDVLETILTMVGENGLNHGAEAKDIEGFTNLAITLINANFELEEAERMLVQLAQGLAYSSPKESSTTVNARYLSLSSLFNSLPEFVNYEIRSSILLSLCKLAISRDDLSILSSALASLPNWLSNEWGLPDSSASDKIVSSFVKVLEPGSSGSVERLEAVRTLLLAYVNDDTEDILKTKLVLYTLASQTAFDIEVLPSISSNPQLAQIKDIFISGKLDDLAKTSADLPPPLDVEKLKEKLQYIVLADYCSNKVGQTVSYEEVASVLGLSTVGEEEDLAMEIEAWIIATIRVKLLAARLHQPSNTISVLRATPRTFGKEQWATLQTRLEAWRVSVSNITDTVGRAIGTGNAGGNRSERLGHDAQAIVQAASGQEQEPPVIEVA